MILITCLSYNGVTPQLLLHPSAFTSWGKWRGCNRLLATVILAWAGMTIAYAWGETLVAPLQGAVLSQSGAQMASNYYYNPSCTIGSKKPEKESTEQILFFQRSYARCEGLPARKCLTWALSLFSFVLNCAPITKGSSEKKIWPTTPTGSWTGCTNRSKWRSKSSCTVLKVSIKMKEPQWFNAVNRSWVAQ